MRTFGHHFSKPLNGGDSGLDGVSLVGGIEREQKLPLRPDESQLCGGGAGINAEKAVAAVGSEIAFFDHGLAVPVTESAVILLAFKQRRQTLEFKGHGDPGIEPRNQVVHIHGVTVRCLQGCAPGGKKVGIVGVNDVLIT